MRPASAPRLQLRGPLRARSLPLSIALVVVVTLSAPTAFYVVSVRQLRTRAAAVASQVALRLRLAAQQRPRLWRYDSNKLVHQLDSLRADTGVGAIEVLDPDSRPLAGDFPSASEDSPTAWQAQPVKLGPRTVATVWVAAPLSPSRRMALGLMLPFGLLGLLLGGLLHGLPMRTVGRAEARIHHLLSDLAASRAALQEVNRDLEAQVEARVADLRHAHEDLQRADARLRGLAAQASGLQAAERRAIARDLHDGAGQVLTAIRLNLQVLQGQRQPAPELAASTLSLVDAAIDEIRRAVDSLGPSIIDDVGLVEAVRTHCRDVSECTEVQVEFEVDGEGPPLPPAVENAAYRIVQEALHNVVKHAGASRARVRLRLASERLSLSVCDDGSGPEAPGDSSPGHGVENMRARAEILGGGLSIGGGPGGGTRVDATLPLRVEGGGEREGRA